MGLGFGELVLLLFVVLLFFGAGKLPAIGEGLGKAVRGFRDAARAGTPPGRPAERQAERLPAGPSGSEEPKA